MKTIVAVLIVILVIFSGGVFWYKSEQNKKQEVKLKEFSEVFVRDYSAFYGNKDAKVVLVEFFDPACGTCAQFYPLVKDFLTKYNGKIKVAYRYAPFHKNSNFIVAILEALRLQDKFDEALATLFKYNDAWVIDHESNVQLAMDILLEIIPDIDLQKLYDDLQSPEIQRRVEQDYKDLTALGVNKTPGFFVNGKPLETFGYENLVYLIESEIKQNY